MYAAWMYMCVGMLADVYHHLGDNGIECIETDPKMARMLHYIDKLLEGDFNATSPGKHLVFCA